MHVEDFPRPPKDNRRGIHWSASVYHPAGSALDFWVGELKTLGIKWVKLLDDSGGSSLELCKRLLAAEIMPIVRLFRAMPNPGTIGSREADTIKRLVAAGVRYFETNNEPDLSAEWKDGYVPPDWMNVVVDSFITDADIVIGLGGLPALPALSIGCKANLLKLVVQKGRADLFRSGAWVALHNYTLNHPLDYPYDEVNQAGAPVSQEEYDRLGGWAWDNTPRAQINEWRATDKNPGDTLEEDASCFLSVQLLDQTTVKLLGHKVPIISTEGGPVTGWRDDRRYPRVNPYTQAQWTVAINEFLQGGREINGLRCPDNYFTLCHWLIGNYKLGFIAPGWESQSWYTDWWNGDFSLHGEMPVVAVVKAMPSSAVDGTNLAVVAGVVLRLDDDAPLPGLTLTLRSGDQEVASTVTAADGTFRFDRLAPGPYDLAIAAWGVVRRGITAMMEPVQPVTIRLSGGSSSSLTGTVQSASGAPLSGLAVKLSRDGAAVAETSTAADGSFRFSGLPLGAYRLAIPGITVAGLALDGWQSKNLKLTTGAPAGYRYTVIQQRLLSAAETANRNVFYGVVNDASGAPLNGIKVQMAWHGAGPDTEFPVTVTGSNPFRPAGSYEFFHTQGLFKLQVLAGDWPSDVADNLETARVPGREGQPITYEVNFQLQPTGLPAQVDGVVPGGQPGRIVRLTGPAGSYETPLKADSSFVFANLAPGDYRLELAGIGVIAADITLAAGSLFKQIFPLRSVLAGQVLTPSDGLVAVLYALQPWSWTRQAPVNLDGTFVFEGLPAGHYRLEIAAQVFSDLVLTGENRLQLAPIDLVPGRHSVIRGRVADGGGVPKGDVIVTLRQQGLLMAQTRTAVDGTYRFADLAAGTYSVEVAGGKTVVINGIVLDGTGEYVADVVWALPDPHSVVQGHVLTGDGSVVAGAVVRLLQSGAEIARTQSDASGAFRFTGLLSGAYALAVGEGDSLIAEIQVGEAMTVTQDLILPLSPDRLVDHYFLFARSAPGMPAGAEQRLALSLASDYLSSIGVCGGFSPQEAATAARVIIVGDDVPASVEETLRRAGCQVARLPGDGFALAAAFARLTAALREG
jgi:hypothetical protein